MVCYCCVQGCKNTSIIKSKSPNTVISFHGFPSNQGLKTKWVRAIGRPLWDPPTHARICSAHFGTDDLILYDATRLRLKNDAVPTKALPPNANFDASNVETCRICLAVDIKMYNIATEHLSTYFDSFTGLASHPVIEGLPNYVCYFCWAVVMKCHRLFEKSLVSQTVLLDIFAQNGEINKKLIKESDHCKLQTNPFAIYTASNDIPAQLNFDRQELAKTSKESADSEEILLINKDSEGNFIIYQLDESNQFVNKCIGDEDVSIKAKVDQNTFDFETNAELVKDPKKGDVPAQFEDDDKSRKDEDTESDDNSDVEIDLSDNNKEDSENELDMKHLIAKDEGLSGNASKLTNKRRERTTETEMREYFDIVKLSLSEQIEEWKTAVSSRSFKSGSEHKCEVCGKRFLQAKLLTVHMRNHDPSRGKAQCPVCKRRLKNANYVESHIKRDHSRKFSCKMCPKKFFQLRFAKSHQLYHAGHKYKCTLCSYSALHSATMYRHMQIKHRQPHACIACGRAFLNEHGLTRHRLAAHPDFKEEKSMKKTFRCKICKIDFASEGARRMHELTSTQHCVNNTSDPLSSGDFNCIKCGETFSSHLKLKLHNKMDHPKQITKTTPSSPLIQCKYCDETVYGRKQHWYHVRREHPRQTKNYEAIITVICDICGKGFQNLSKLESHKLRHNPPKVSCPHCPGLFYDQHALSMHATTHTSLRPYVCGTCGQAFKLKKNYARHAAVHSDATRYKCEMCDKKFKYSTSLNLHVRTVHNKEPHPVRNQKKTRSKNDDDVKSTSTIDLTKE